MKSKSGLKLFVIFTIVIFSISLFGCSQPTADVNNADEQDTVVEENTTEDVQTEEEEVAEESTSEETESAGETEEETEGETETEAGPTQGGILVISGLVEPTTLDPALTTASELTKYLSAALVYLAPNGDIVPYLAESWETSEDDKIWTFHLKQDVVFTDGTPLTAHDFVWTYNRALDPEIASPLMPMLLGDVVSIEAPDDYTLEFTYETPFSALLYNLTDSGYTQPMSQAAFESGFNYERDHIGVGPFMLKEWVTADHITFERNPNFTWGPEFTHQGPVYLDEVTFRFIPEYATIMAGLESGEILATEELQAQDVQRLEDMGGFKIHQTIQFGISSGVFLNVSVAPFDDINVRQALSYAIDRESARDVVYSGYGEVTSGPLNSGTFGYWEGIEEIGYHYDVEKANELMIEAGYAKNDEGIWEKDGEPLSINIKVNVPDGDDLRKFSEVLESQWTDFGIDCTLQLSDSTFDDIVAGNYTAAIAVVNWGDGGEFMRLVFHSEVLNVPHANDPELDEILNNIAITLDPVQRQEVVDQAAIYIMEHAYVINAVARPSFVTFNSAIGGDVVNPIGDFVFFDLYLTE